MRNAEELKLMAHKIVNESAGRVIEKLNATRLEFSIYDSLQDAYQKGAEDMRSRILHRIEEREIASMNQERAQWAAELFAELKAIPLHPEGGGR